MKKEERVRSWRWGTIDVQRDRGRKWRKNRAEKGREWKEESDGRREESKKRRMNRRTGGREKARVGVRKEDRDKQGYS